MRAWMWMIGSGIVGSGLLGSVVGCGGANTPAISTTADTVDAGRAVEAAAEASATCHRTGCQGGCGSRDDGCGGTVYCGSCTPSPMPTTAPMPTGTTVAPVPDASAATADACQPVCAGLCSGWKDGCGGYCPNYPNGGVCPDGDFCKLGTGCVACLRAGSACGSSSNDCCAGLQCSNGACL